jgi:eukaryotic-like serine/threonine-protein kinase
MQLTDGTKLGPYEIVSPIGAGGMGEVYRSRDTRLGRDVAIKVLPLHLSANPDLKERFDREARAISSLNHARICILYDVGNQDGIDFLVMEFLEGESLADRLHKGPLPLKDVLKIGTEVCEALEAAHSVGIIHRDLKPGNVMLTNAGAKLMDFGLAKASSVGAVSGRASAPLLSGARTMSGASPLSPLTTAGAVVGTIQYMSPEQIEGKEADARSDLFALGATLYEMASGKRPFEGKSQISVASAILEKDPESISSFQPMTPPAFEHLLDTCLKKNPDDRFQTAHDVGLQLRWIAETPTASPAPLPQPTKSRELSAWAVAGALGLALIAAAIWWLASRPTPQATFFSAPLPFSARDVAVSPNGHTIALVGYRESERKNVIWIYEPGSPDAIMLANTEGATFPFWSAEGRSLAFFADAKLKKIEISGGPVQTLCDAPNGRGGAWNKDDVIVFTPSGQLGVGVYRIPASGGTPTQITFPDRTKGEDSHRWPQFLPDGTHFLYLAMNLSGRKDLSGIYVGALGSQEKRLVATARANAAYTAPGYLLFYRDQTLFAQHFDAKKLEVSGEPAPILNDLEYSPRIARTVFAASGGLLVAQKSGQTALSQLLWLDRKGEQLGAAAKPGLYGDLALAPDGASIAVDVTDSASQNTDVWAMGAKGAKRLTFDPAIDTMGLWSPDATRLIFSSNRGLKFDLFWKSADGAQEEKPFLEDASDKYATSWSHDGKFVLYARGTDLYYMTLPEQQSHLFLKAPSSLKTGHFSPDGKWVAYTSNESGKWEIYVSSFPDAHGKWQVSSGGGEQPNWRADGRELFYLSSDDKLMAVPVTTGANFDAGTPVVLFQANPREQVATSEQLTYDVSKDGQRFLVNTQLKQGETTPMSVVQNWAAKLNK